MNIIFNVRGGIGKHIMATAVCKGIKTKYPDSNLIVITGYPDVFLNNPYIYRLYHPANLSFFYEDHIKNKSVTIFNTDPYESESYILRRKHLIECWFECFNLPYQGEVPEIFLTGAEFDLFYKTKNNTKPILVFQPAGRSDSGYNWVRDIPVTLAQTLATHFSEKFDVYHIRTSDQQELDNTTSITTSNLREIFQIIQNSHARLLIDSFVQHAAAALQTPSVVCWIHNSPKIFGYSIHNNIRSKPPNMFVHNYKSVLEDFSFMSPYPEQCPYKSYTDIFDTQSIIHAVTENSLSI